MIGLMLLVFAAVFFGVVAMFLLTSVLRSPSAVLTRRLEQLEKEKGRDFAQTAAESFLRQQPPEREEALLRLPLLRSIKRLVVHSGIRATPYRFMALDLLATALCFCLLQLVFRQLPLALLAALFVALLPYAFLHRQKKKRQQKFEEQLPDTLSMMARSLRAGHSLTAALELVANEQPEPSSTLFRSAYEQQQLGMRTPDALAAILDRIESMDLHFFVSVIRLNSETGGNLSELLEKLAETVRARLQLRRQVQTYTAEGRLSGYVLLALPVAVFFAFQIRNPKYMEPFFTVPVCRWSLFLAGAAQLIGFLIMRKIVRIRI
jgi:tight adherence protein B